MYRQMGGKIPCPQPQVRGNRHHLSVQFVLHQLQSVLYSGPKQRRSSVRSRLCIHFGKHRKGIQWERIRILGGEPTLHPELMGIMDLLAAYKDAYDPCVRIIVCTNGCGEKVNRMISLLPGEIDIKNIFKTGTDRLFRPFNLTPVGRKMSDLIPGAPGR
jgi:hypothetical protein